MNFHDYSTNISIENNRSDCPVLILLDMEGIIGVSSMNIASMSRNIELAYSEVALVVSALHQAGYNNITLCNIHNDGKCLEKEKLSELNISLIEGVKNLYPKIGNFKFALMIGFHGKRNSGGVFDHTFRMDIYSFKIAGTCIGEVGAYYRWLNANGVRVVFVSGEGFFADEIDNKNSILHVINGQHNFKQARWIENEYHRFNHLVCSSLRLNSSLFQESIYSSEEVEIELDNPDKYTLLKDLPFCTVQSSCIHFSSLDSFFKYIIEFSSSLNSATKTITDQNIRFARYIRSLNISPSTLMKMTSDISDKNISEVTSADRNEILRRISVVL